MKYLILFLFMIFCHIVDDYYLQGILASMKQRKWWKNNAPEPMYKYDWAIALLEHAFSWAFMVHLPLLLYRYLGLIEYSGFVFLASFIINWIIHAVVDHLKANLFKINLIQDQIFHICQIIMTWLIFANIGRHTT